MMQKCIEKKRTVYGFAFFFIRKPFRVPLHTNDREIVVAQSLHYTIVAVLDIGQRGSLQIHALMMGAVYHKPLPVKPVEDSARQGKGLMVLISIRVLMAVSGWQILMDVTTEENIDELHSPADTKNRLFFRYKGFQDRKLQSVKNRIKKTGTAVKLTKQDGIDIAATGKEKSVIG